MWITSSLGRIFLIFVTTWATYKFFAVPATNGRGRRIGREALEKDEVSDIGRVGPIEAPPRLSEAGEPLPRRNFDKPVSRFAQVWEPKIFIARRDDKLRNRYGSHLASDPPLDLVSARECPW